jgi:hypothetical protein
MPQLDVMVDREQVAVGDEFAVAVSTPPLTRTGPVRAEFALALDASPSMRTPALGLDRTGASRWDLARHGAQVLLERLPGNTAVHLVIFGDTAEVVAAGRAGELLPKVGTLLPAEPPARYVGTNIEDGLTAAYAALETSSAVSRRIILFSDGEPTMGRTRPSDLARLTADAAKRDLHTDPVGIGAEADVDLLLSLAATGVCDHVERAEDAARAMGAAMGRIGDLGRNAVAGGGDLEVSVSPYFPVVRVYQLTPTKRLLDGATHVQGDGSTRIALTLGTIGADDDRPMFGLLLRAPDQAHSGPLPLLRASGVVRGGTGPITLEAMTATVQPVESVDGYFDGRIMDMMREADLERRVAEQTRNADDERLALIYQDARDQAAQAGHRELSEQYGTALAALGRGQEGNDVRNTQRSMSSRATTRPRDILMKTPIRKPPPRPSADAEPPADEWEDDDGYRAPVTRPRGQ